LTIATFPGGDGLAVQRLAHFRDSSDAVYVQSRILHEPPHYLILKIKRLIGFKRIGNLQDKFLVVFYFQPKILVPFAGKPVAFTNNSKKIGGNLFSLLPTETGRMLDD
jgi:hypothetical protein